MHEYNDVIVLTTYHGTKHFFIRYRVDPVPFTGVKHSYGHWLRHPKTQNERRQSFNWAEYVKPRRQAKQLVTYWDDEIRSDVYD